MRFKYITAKRYISSLILFALLTGLFSCGSTGTADDTTAEPGESTTTQAEIDSDIYADLPTGDYGGIEFNILNNSFTYAEYRLDADALNGDTFNDAVYERTRKVEEMLGVKINVKNMDYWSRTPYPLSRTSSCPETTASTPASSES